jgi:hypothetical protein
MKKILFVAVVAICLGCAKSKNDSEIYVNGKTRAQISAEIENALKDLPPAQKEIARESAWKAVERNAAIERDFKERPEVDRK